MSTLDEAVVECKARLHAGESIESLVEGPFFKSLGLLRALACLSSSLGISLEEGRRHFLGSASWQEEMRRHDLFTAAWIQEVLDSPEP